MAAAEKTVPRFHHKCFSYVTLSDNNTTAAETGGWTPGTVFSSVPLHQLHNNRFVYIIKTKGPYGYAIYDIGVTRSDPGDLAEIPEYASDVPQTWCVCPDTGSRWENSREVDTGEVTGVTHQEGDVWCVEVTPGGQVYIYHNYNQPWGSPVFTLPPDTTQVWAVVSLGITTISVVPTPAMEFSVKYFCQMLRQKPISMSKADEILANKNFTCLWCEAYGNKTAMGFVAGLILERPEDKEALTQVLLALLKHPDAKCVTMESTADLLQLDLELWECPAARQRYRSLVSKIIGMKDVNAILDRKNGRTAAHLCAVNGITEYLDQILLNQEFNPNIQDTIHGNTVLFYICDHLRPNKVKAYLTELQIKWDYDIKNNKGQRVVDFYKYHTEPNDGILQLLRDNTNGGTMSALPPSVEPTVNITKRGINLRLVNATQGKLFVKPSATPITDTLRDKASMIYNITKARKGRALIISLSRYHPTLQQRFCDLPGYEEDAKQITDVFTQIGFDVFLASIAQGAGNHCLTVEEIQAAVKKFASQLTTDDCCAVLVILSHGGEGFIYGSDGKRVYLTPLLRYLDNVNCLQMAGKPKVVIIQACQGKSSDHGVAVRAHVTPESPAVPAAGPTNLLIPAISDFIICYPSWPGYASFVRADHSVYISHLLDNLCKFAGSEDIYTILTRVNKSISEEVIVDARNRDNKQMSRFESSLTRLLYFLPAPGGKTGLDWNLDQQDVGSWCPIQ